MFYLFFIVHMYTFKKLFAGVSAAAIVATQAMTAVVYGATGLNDPEFDAALAWMYETGLTKYNTADAFRPYDTLTREQAAKFYAEFAVKALGMTVTTTVQPDFADLSTADATLRDSIVQSYQLGLFKGTAGNFLPQAPLTKAAALTVLVRALAGTQDENVEPWWSNYFLKAKELGLTKETDVYAIDRSITRYEVALMLYRAAKDSDGNTGTDGGDDGVDLGDLLGDLLGGDTGTGSTTGTGTGSTDNGTTTGDDTGDDLSDVEGSVLEVALNPTTPAYTRLPKNSDGVVAAKFDLSAGDKDVTVGSITFKRIGDGSKNAVSNIAVFTRDGRVSKDKSFNSSADEAVVNFNPALKIAAGTTKTINGVVSVGSTAGSQFALQITAINADAEVNSTLPITASLMEVGTTTATQLTLTSTGSISNPKLGEKQVEVAKFKIKNNSTDNEKVMIDSITLEQNGSIKEDTDLVNFTLTIDGKSVASTANTVGGYVTFNLVDPYTIADGKTVEFKVLTDIIGGAGDTVMFTIEKPLDITARGSKYAGIDIAINDDTELQTVTVQAWEVTLIAIDPTVTEVRKDKDDVVLWTIKIESKAGKALELDKFRVTIDRTSGTAALSGILEQVELYDSTNGGTYDLPCSVSSASQLVCGDDINVTIPDTGSITFVVRADTLNTDLVAGTSFRAQVRYGSSNGFVIKETTDDKVVSDVSPSTLTFKTINGQTAGATLSVIPTTTTRNAVIGSKDVPAMEFEVKADDSSDLAIDEITVTASSISGAFDNGTVSEVKLYVDSIADANLLDRVSGSNIASNTVTFDGFNVKVTKNMNRKFFVTVAIVDDITKATSTFRLGIASTGAISIEDEDNDDVFVASTGASNTLVTVRGAGSLSAVVDNADSEVDKAKNVLGGVDKSPFVASFEVTATNEPVKIKDLNIVAAGASGTQFANVVEQVVLFGNDKTTVIGTESVTGPTVTFDNINYTVEEGSQNIYVKLKTRQIGKDKAGSQSADITLSMAVTDAEGANSGKTLSSFPTTSNSLAFAVIPVRISNVQFVDSANGISRASRLNNGENNVAIIAVTTEASINSDTATNSSLKTLLKQIQLRVTHFNATSWTTVNSVSIEKINGTTGSVAGTLSLAGGSGTATFDTTGLGTDAEISNQSVVHYVVKANVTKNGPQDNDDYVKVEFAGFTNSQVLYSSNDSVYSGTNVTDLRIGLTRLDGTQVNE